MGAPRLRNRLEEKLDDISGRLGPVGAALLWPVFELVIWIALLLSPIWFLVTLFIGPGRPPPPGRSAPDDQRNSPADS